MLGLRTDHGAREADMHDVSFSAVFARSGMLVSVVRGFCGVQQPSLRPAVPKLGSGQLGGGQRGPGQLGAGQLGAR